MMRVVGLWLLLWLSPWVAAEERWFGVELILFLNQPIGSQGGEEPLPAVRAEPIQRRLMQANFPFAPLEEGRRQLTELTRALQQSSRYKLLRAFSWVQAVGSKGSAVPARLQPEGGSGSFTANYSDQQGQSHQISIEGNATLSLSRYLHVDLNLLMSDTLTGQTTPPRYYHVQQSRRMKSGEIHYLDHPTVAALIRIQPVGAP